MKRAALWIWIVCLPFLPGCAAVLVALPAAVFTVASEADCEANHRPTHQCRDEILNGDE